MVRATAILGKSRFFGMDVWIPILFFQVFIGLAVIVLPSPMMVFLVLGLVFLIPLLYAMPIIAYGLILLTIPSYNITLLQVGKLDIRPNDVSVIVGLLTLALQWIKHKKVAIDLGKFDIPLLLLFGWVILSIFWTPSPAMGIFQTLKILAALLIYFVMVNLIKDEKAFQNALFLWFLCGFFWAVVGTYMIYFHAIPTAAKLTILEGTLPHLGKTVRVSTFFGGPNDYAFVLSITIMMAILYFSMTDSRLGKPASAVAVILMIVVLIGTFSRKSWLGLALSVFIVGVKKRRIFVLASMLSLLSLALIFWAGSGVFSDALVNRLASFFLEADLSISQRVIAWSVAKKLFVESPIIGQGVGSFFVLSPKAGSPLNIPHNFYWYLLSEYGLIGMLLFTLYIVGLVIHLVRIFKNTLESRVQYVSLVLLATMASVLFQSTFKTIGLTEPIFWAFWGFISIFLRIQAFPVEKGRPRSE